jgi:hypothetical protein
LQETAEYGWHQAGGGQQNMDDSILLKTKEDGWHQAARDSRNIDDSIL